MTKEKLTKADNLSGQTLWQKNHLGMTANFLCLISRNHNFPYQKNPKKQLLVHIPVRKEAASRYLLIFQGLKLSTNSQTKKDNALTDA